MKLKCKLTPIKPRKTLADLDDWVAAETEYGIRWKFYGSVLGLPGEREGHPILAGIDPKDYRITGRIFGRIHMKFEE
jgi:hypothetical protein